MFDKAGCFFANIFDSSDGLSSIHLNDLYNETKESIAKYTQAIKEINLNPESALVNDALQRSLA